jgi:hypothetical protein
MYNHLYSTGKSVFYLPNVLMDTSLALPVVHVEAQDRRLRSVRARTSVPPTQHAPTTSSLAALHKHLLHVYHFDDALRYICIYFYVIRLDPGDWHDGASGSRHHRSARLSGLDPGDWHDGASGSRHHRSARVSGLDPGDRHDGRFSASVPPVWHARSARDRPWFTPAERRRQPRCWRAVGKGIGWRHCTTPENRAQVGGCASSVGCMRCSAAAVQGAHARMSRGLTGLTGRGWPRRRAAPACQRRGRGGTPPQATQCDWCPFLRRGAARRTLPSPASAGSRREEES